MRFRKAVLIIHGFTGNLYDNEYLMNYLELDSKYDVYAKTLPGHNKGRFSKAKVDDWKDFVDGEIKELINNGYRKIYVIGHSMGGVLAAYVGSKYKEIKKIVFVNAAFDYMNLNNKKDFEGKNTPKYSYLLEKALRTSPFMLLEFKKMVEEGKDYLDNITCPALILRSTNDEIVPYNTGDLVYEKIKTPNNKKWITNIIDASHAVLRSEKKEITSEYIRKFLRGGRIWKKNMKEEI